MMGRARWIPPRRDRPPGGLPPRRARPGGGRGPPPGPGRGGNRLRPGADRSRGPRADQLEGLPRPRARDPEARRGAARGLPRRLLHVGRERSLRRRLAAEGRARARARARASPGRPSTSPSRGSTRSRRRAGSPPRASPTSRTSVVVAYVLNDSEDEKAAEARRAADWVEEQKQAAVPVAPRPLGARPARAARVRATVENRRRVDGFRSMYADDYPGWVAARRALEAMGGLCRERGVPLVVAIFPLFGNRLDESYPFADVHAKVARPRRSRGRGSWTCCLSTGASTGGCSWWTAPTTSTRTRSPTASRRRRSPARCDEVVPRAAKGAAPREMSGAIARARGRRGGPAGRALGPRDARPLGHVRRGRAPAGRLHPPRPRRPPPEPRAAAAREAARRGAAPARSDRS